MFQGILADKIDNWGVGLPSLLWVGAAFVAAWPGQGCSFSAVVGYFLWFMGINFIFLVGGGFSWFSWASVFFFC